MRQQLADTNAEHAALVMLNHEVNACFVTWCAATGARVAALAVLGRAVAALRQRGLRRALNGWLDAAQSAASASLPLLHLRILKPIGS